MQAVKSNIEDLKTGQSRQEQKQDNLEQKFVEVQQDLSKQISDVANAPIQQKAKLFDTAVGKIILIIAGALGALILLGIKSYFNVP